MNVDDELEDDEEVCEHGVSFDEDCDECEDEIDDDDEDEAS